jgi:hypothetical protein
MAQSTLNTNGRRMHWLLHSRLGVVLLFGVLLLALDVGRSIWARVGYETYTFYLAKSDQPGCR